MAEFIFHEPCECGSSDGRAVYGDGHKFCFVCSKWFHPEGKKAHTGVPDRPSTAVWNKQIQPANQLVQGSGDDDNSRFMILGDLLMAAHRFDYEEKVQYSIRVRSTDLGINHIENVFIINIIDIDETTGLRELNTNGLNIFPNPFSHSTTIRFPNPSGESFRMVLMDLSGKTYMNEDEITTSEYVLQKGDLKKGLYFIELRGPKIYRGKIVIAE